MESLQGYICEPCAKSKGWITAYPTGGNTVTRHAICPHCNKWIEEYLTPECDFKKKPTDPDPVWD